MTNMIATFLSRHSVLKAGVDDPVEAHRLPQRFGRLWIVLLVAAVSMGVVYGIIAAVLELAIAPHWETETEATTSAAAAEAQKTAAAEEGTVPGKFGVSDTDVFANMSDDQFSIYVIFVVWATVGKIDRSVCFACVRALPFPSSRFSFFAHPPASC